jgi:peptide/nickel transport system substrate-binding protein
MRIELDAPGPDGKPVPHWLSKPAPAVLKLVVRKVGPRQLRLALHARIIGSIIPSSFEFCWQPPGYGYDPARAKQLLVEAGYPNGFDAGDYFCDAAITNIGEPVANYLNATGIRVKLRPIERAAYFKGFAEKKYKGLIHAASGAFGNAATRIEAFIVGGGTYAYGSYADIDGLSQEQATELDPRRRAATLERIQQLIHEKAMVAPIYLNAGMNGLGRGWGSRGSGPSPATCGPRPTKT